MSLWTQLHWQLLLDQAVISLDSPWCEVWSICLYHEPVVWDLGQKRLRKRSLSQVKSGIAVSVPLI